jgi:hypothetical protein
MPADGRTDMKKGFAILPKRIKSSSCPTFNRLFLHYTLKLLTSFREIIELYFMNLTDHMKIFCEQTGDFLSVRGSGMCSSGMCRSGMCSSGMCRSGMCNSGMCNNHCTLNQTVFFTFYRCTKRINFIA